MIFESHAHYDDEAFDKDREELLASLPANGIDTVINVGASLESCKTTLELMDKYPFIYGAIGVHPSETGALKEEDFRWLQDCCKLEKVVAVGEIGLDYHWKEPEPPVQKRCFERQLGIAREVKLPVIIHSRDAAKDTLDMMKSLHAGEIGGVIHCFSYTKEIAKEYLGMGYYFGIGGVITFANAKKLKEAVAYIPIENILLETDCPYLAPEPNRGRRNSSLNLPHIARAIAEIKGIDYEQTLRVTHENAERLFRIAQNNA
ncbi:MAG: TatD family hydrolase [Blautia sp.]|nr:TatD family hydrolase [Lachnoclostridium sp.]MCM1211587.1 TatD family hydrolase [Blautia sp.]